MKAPTMAARLKMFSKPKKTFTKEQNSVSETVAGECPRKDIPSEEYFLRISDKAYELYEKHGCNNGHDLDDWLEAERLVKEDICKIF